jgi:hypothetical protein
MIKVLRDGCSAPLLNTLRFAGLALLLVILHDVSSSSAWGQTVIQRGRRLQLPPPPPPPAVTSKVDTTSTLGKALASCDKVQEDQFVLPGLKGEIKLDHCYRGREHFICRYDALLAEGKSLIDEFTRIVDEHYQDVGNVEGVCKISAETLGKDSMGAAEFSRRFAAARSEYETHTACANKVKQAIREVTLPDLTQAPDLLKSITDSIDSDITRTSSVQEQVAALAVKMESSQKAIGLIQKIHRSICPKAGPAAEAN